MKDSKQKTRTCEACIMETHAYYPELIDNVMYATKTCKTALFLHALWQSHTCKLTLIVLPL